MIREMLMNTYLLYSIGNVRAGECEILKSTSYTVIHMPYIALCVFKFLVKKKDSHFYKIVIWMKTYDLTLYIA